MILPRVTGSGRPAASAVAAAAAEAGPSDGPEAEAKAKAKASMGRGAAWGPREARAKRGRCVRCARGRRRTRAFGAPPRAMRMFPFRARRLLLPHRSSSRAQRAAPRHGKASAAWGELTQGE